MPRRKPREEKEPGSAVPRRGGRARMSETAFTPQGDDGEALRSTLFGPKGQRSQGVLAGRGITSKGVGGGNATVERVSGVGQRTVQKGFTDSPVQPSPAVPGSAAAPISSPPSAPTVVGPGSLIGKKDKPRPRGTPGGLH